jgi:hypothetical protein
MKKRMFVVLIGMFFIGLISAACPAGFPADAICDGSGTVFEVKDELFFCEYDGDTAEWVNKDGRFPVKLGDDSGINCKKDQTDVATGSGTSCCPIGSVCEKFFGGVWKCVTSTNQFCSDYSKDDCENYVEWVPEETFKLDKSYTGFCENPITSGPWKNASGDDCWSIKDACACVWNDNGGLDNNGICEHRVYNQTYCGDEFITVGSCSYGLSKWEDKCDIRGFIVASWNATWLPSTDPAPEDCADIIDQDVPCSSITRLPFFGLFNFIISSLAIIGIYCFILRKRENEV